MEEQPLCPKGNKVPIRTSSSARVVLSTCVVVCGSLAYGFAVGYSSPSQSGIMADLGLSIADYSAFGAILTLGGTIGALVSGTIADMVGRRVTMWIMDLCFIMGWLSIIFATVFSIFYSMGVGGAAVTIISEIFPMNIKGSAGSLAIVCNWFTSWIVTYAFNFLFEWNPSGVFFMFTFFSGMMIPFVAKIVPETKGRTLEEIQASMTLLN